jgi:hypothetical protein
VHSGRAIGADSEKCWSIPERDSFANKKSGRQPSQRNANQPDLFFQSSKPPQRTMLLNKGDRSNLSKSFSESAI